MKIGSLSAAWSTQPLEEVLDFFAGAGLQAIEIGAGAYPGSAHCDAAKLNKDAKARKAFVNAIESRGLVLSALSVHGNPLHPDKAIAEEHHNAFVEAVKLAGSIGVKCVNGFSGLIIVSPIARLTASSTPPTMPGRFSGPPLHLSLHRHRRGAFGAGQTLHRTALQIGISSSPAGDGCAARKSEHRSKAKSTGGAVHEGHAT